MKKYRQTIFMVVMVAGIMGLIVFASGQSGKGNQMKTIDAYSNLSIEELIKEKDLSTIYLAGGCFWGVEEYMTRIEGVYDAASGYANGTTENPSYEDVIYKKTGHAETVRVVYDSKEVSLKELLEKFFKVVDPTSVNQQGNDRGSQYRSGIYYENEEDKEIAKDVLDDLQKEYDKEIVVENLPLDNFYLAEEYHQNYLQKNPNGYCHINLDLADEFLVIEEESYDVPKDEEIKENLSSLAYDVTQNGATERAFTSELNDNKAAGVYVDIVTGEPLFLSNDKYDSGSGWPSFTRPISEDVIIEKEDNTLFMQRVEVKSRVGDTHLGHVFEDGPVDDGGLRYCINGAALKFIPYENMAQEGYGHLSHLVEIDSE